jgi:hypothetical protein
VGILRNIVHKCNIFKLLEKREDQLDVNLFKCLHIRLSWAFLHSIFFLHDYGISQYDLSLDNILFYRDDDRMYIGICDWGRFPTYI